MMVEVKRRREGYYESQANCSNEAARRKEWRKLWNMKLPSKIRVFCWRLAQNSIPTASVLKNRNMTKTAKYRICGAADDTWELALFICTMSRCVWAQLGENIIELITTLHMADPMHLGLFICTNIQQEMGIQILVTCWAIWHARRKAIHEGFFQSPLAIITIVSRVIEELQFIEEIEVNENFYQSKVSSCRWIAFDPNQYKINVNAAVGVGVRGVVEAIYRDVKGKFIAACVRIIPHITDPETLEAIAYCEAPALAEDCCIRKMKVASHCLNVINNINEMPRSLYMMILQETHERLNFLILYIFYMKVGMVTEKPMY
jgi:hypothetical protein